ncbi:MAG: hypothetical protein WAV41_01375 [Microgenomates group bacterium]
MSKLGILISVRQLVFLGKNIYNLYYSPYLTIKKIKESEDKSQIFLIGMTALAPIIFYVVLRIIYDLLKFGRMVAMTGNVFVAMIIIQAIMLGYLWYWTYRVYKVESL